MRRQMEGSRAVAETVARCRPEVISAYPISPQTHIVEALSGGAKNVSALAAETELSHATVSRHPNGKKVWTLSLHSPASIGPS